MCRAALSSCLPLALLLAPGCAGKSNPSAEQGGPDTPPASAAPAAPIAPASVPAPLSDCQAKDPIELTDARVEGGELVLALQHSAGCAEHHYSLCWAGQAFMESAPPQVQLSPWHDAGGEMCEALAQVEQRFDLAPLRQGQEHGTVLIQISGRSVDYTW